jgi:ribosomal protein L37AE/L43A
MGFVEYFDETTGQWINIEDIPMIDTVNCQLCNEPTMAKDIIAEILVKDEQLIVGAWQCRKCKAVNG